MKLKKRAPLARPVPNLWKAPLPTGHDESVPPMFGGPPPVQVQGVKTSALGVGDVTGVAKPRH